MIHGETKRGVNAGSAGEEKKNIYLCVFGAGSDGQESFMEEVAFHLGIKVWVRSYNHCWKEKPSERRTCSKEEFSRCGRC